MGIRERFWFLAGGGRYYFKSFQDVQQNRLTFDQMRLQQSEVKKLFYKFRMVDHNNLRHLTIDDFDKLVDIESHGFLRRIFKVFDESGDGYIDFMEFVVGCWNYCTSSKRSLVTLAFDLYDEGAKGYLTPEDLEAMFEDFVGIDFQRNRHARETAKKFRTKCRARDRPGMRLLEFQEFAETHSNLLFLFFTLQRRLSKITLGLGRWKTITKRTSDMRIDGKYDSRSSSTPKGLSLEVGNCGLEDFPGQQEGGENQKLLTPRTSRSSSHFHEFNGTLHSRRKSMAQAPSTSSLSQSFQLSPMVPRKGNNSKVLPSPLPSPATSFGSSNSEGFGDFAKRDGRTFELPSSQDGFQPASTPQHPPRRDSIFGFIEDIIDESVEESTLFQSPLRPLARAINRFSLSRRTSALHPGLAAAAASSPDVLALRGAAGAGLGLPGSGATGHRRSSAPEGPLGGRGGGRGPGRGGPPRRDSLRRSSAPDLLLRARRGSAAAAVEARQQQRAGRRYSALPQNLYSAGSEADDERSLATPQKMGVQPRFGEGRPQVQRCTAPGAAKPSPPRDPPTFSQIAAARRRASEQMDAIDVPQPVPSGRRPTVAVLPLKAGGLKRHAATLSSRSNKSHQAFGELGFTGPTPKPPCTARSTINRAVQTHLNVVAAKEQQAKVLHHAMPQPTSSSINILSNEDRHRATAMMRRGNAADRAKKKHHCPRILPPSSATGMSGEDRRRATVDVMTRRRERSSSVSGPLCATEGTNINVRPQSLTIRSTKDTFNVQSGTTPAQWRRRAAAEAARRRSPKTLAGARQRGGSTIGVTPSQALLALPQPMGGSTANTTGYSKKTPVCLPHVRNRVSLVRTGARPDLAGFHKRSSLLNPPTPHRCATLV